MMIIDEKIWLLNIKKDCTQRKNTSWLGSMYIERVNENKKGEAVNFFSVNLVSLCMEYLNHRWLWNSHVLKNINAQLGASEHIVGGRLNNLKKFAIQYTKFETYIYILAHFLAFKLYNSKILYNSNCFKMFYITNYIIIFIILINVFNYLFKYINN